jgi:hypothetical protein
VAERLSDEEFEMLLLAMPTMKQAAAFQGIYIEARRARAEEEAWRLNATAPALYFDELKAAATKSEAARAAAYREARLANDAKFNASADLAALRRVVGPLTDGVRAIANATQMRDESAMEFADRLRRKAEALALAAKEKT